MAPVRAHRYEFNAKSIAAVRTRMKMKQTKLAELLGVPANTLSRWETGATTPDANSLAAIYSIAQDNGQSVNFFEERAMPPRAQNQRSRAVIMADFQNLGVSTQNVQAFNDFVRSEVNRRVPGATSTIFKAFSSPHQSEATDGLQSLGWRIWEDESDWDDDIAQQAKSDCGADPQGIALFLITRDGDFVDLVNVLRRRGVRVYLLARPNANQNLLDAVGSRRVIQWPAELR